MELIHSGVDLRCWMTNCISLLWVGILCCHRSDLVFLFCPTDLESGGGHWTLLETALEHDCANLRCIVLVLVFCHFLSW